MAFVRLLTAAASAVALLGSVVVADDSGLPASAYYVKNLPGAPAEPQVKMHAGHIEITPEHHGNLFFWLFESQHISKRTRTILWLNGGPGCSSEDGALMEIGPYRVKPDQTLEWNNGSWNQFANLLFVDNPVGVGYSYVDTDSYLNELNQMADNMVTFLEKFFATFPEHADSELYIAGESYAGQYIPYISSAILARNKKKPADAWNLKSLVIGNGWISPPEQYRATLDYVTKKGLLPSSGEARNQVEDAWSKCANVLGDGQPEHVDYGPCEAVLQNFLRYTSKIGDDGKDMCYNMYDVRLKDTYPSCGMSWPPDLPAVTKYLRRSDVVKALNVNPAKSTSWTECSGGVGSAFRARKSVPSIQMIPDILKEVPMAFFSGAEDLICNYMGTEALLGNLTWNGGKGFETTPGNWAPRRDWTFDGQKAGFWQEARNVSFILFNEASHMVPFDWPERSLDMINRVMKVDRTQGPAPGYISYIDGESTSGSPTTPGSKPPASTSPSGGSNGTDTDTDHQKELEEAQWLAYRKSGEIVLMIVAVAAVAWGWWVWRERRKSAGYSGLRGDNNSRSGTSIRMGSRGMRTSSARDVEAAAAEYDERLLQTPTDINLDRYSVGAHDSDDDLDDESDSQASKSEPGTRSVAR
ncbi:Pheromone-processing carboxypeptidase KEX1 [Ceratocystis platani]|uniref:Carboxypeptidase n=1 Tax=Ceratocystis fimbriata f. sp. platani TaxID=88771 RepID=A0A0F8AYL9_CERFI|nr:Pheromone-processing carboxypeptidase KEX1 [Ceratocystis platani]